MKKDYVEWKCDLCGAEKNTEREKPIRGHDYRGVPAPDVLPADGMDCPPVCLTPLPAPRGDNEGAEK